MRDVLRQFDTLTKAIATRRRRRGETVEQSETRLRDEVPLEEVRKVLENAVRPRGGTWGVVRKRAADLVPEIRRRDPLLSRSQAELEALRQAMRDPDVARRLYYEILAGG